MDDFGIGLGVFQVDVEIATPEIIVSVYLLLFVPLAMAWAYFVHYGCKETPWNTTVQIIPKR